VTLLAETLCRPVVEGRRQVWFIARDENGQEIDAIEVSGPNAGNEGLASGVDLGDRELRQMWHAPRQFEDLEVIGRPGAKGGHPQVGVRTWTMRVNTMATLDKSWSQVENRLWSLTTPDRHSGRTGQFFIRFKEFTGEAREIQVRRNTAPEPSSDLFAGQRGHENWSFEVAALDPWWYGPTITRRFENADGSGEAVLRMRNPGDQPGHLRWIIPQSEHDQTWTIPDGLGVYPAGHERAGERIMHELPTVRAGEIAEVDTRPYRLPFRVLGHPMSFGRMQLRRFTHPLPPRSDWLDLPVSVDGGLDAGIEVRLQPAYDRPHS